MDLARRLLSSLLSDFSEPDRVLPMLSEEDFPVGELREVFLAMVELRKRGEPIDESLLTEQLATQQVKDPMATVLGLDSTGAVPGTSSLPLAQGLRRSRVRVELQTLFASLEKRASKEDPVGLIGAARDSLIDIAKKAPVTGCVSLKSCLTPSMDKLLAPSQRVSTGLTRLDAKLGGGVGPGDFIILGARPGCGKSTILTNIANHMVLDQGVSVLFCSLEVTRDQYTQNAVLSRAGASVSGYREGLSMPAVKDAMVEISESQAQLWHCDESPLTPTTLEARARGLQGVGVIIVDYLQLMRSSSGGHQSRYAEFTDISNSLKRLAIGMSVPVLSACQLNRAPAGDDAEPQLHHLRDSGSMEQDADAVALIDRERSCLNLVKNRRGPVGKIPLEFQFEIGRVVEA